MILARLLEARQNRTRLRTEDSCWGRGDGRGTRLPREKPLQVMCGIGTQGIVELPKDPLSEL